MQGLVEQEISYRWFRTCKDAEDWCMRKGAGAPKDSGKPRPPAAANNLGNDIKTSRDENGQAQPVPRLLCSDPAGGDPDTTTQ